MRRSLAITIAALGLIWLASLAVLLCYLAGLANTPALVGAIVLQIGVACLGASLLLVSNTRRPRGLDPDAVRESHEIGVLLPDGRPYGRRQRDDRSVVDRLSEVLEAEAAKRPGPAHTPEWAIGLARDAGQIEIADERGPDDDAR